MIKAADMLIARRADTRARADFATWKMMAKLNGASALPPEAQKFLTDYKTMLEAMTEAEASEATIALMYKAYYAEMGGAGAAPDVKAEARVPVADNVTAFKRPAAQLALELALAMQDVEHGLHGGIGKLLFKAGLHGADVACALPPDDLHDLEFELGEGIFFALLHAVIS